MTNCLTCAKNQTEACKCKVDDSGTPFQWTGKEFIIPLKQTLDRCYQTGGTAPPTRTCGECLHFHLFTCKGIGMEPSKRPIDWYAGNLKCFKPNPKKVKV